MGKEIDFLIQGETLSLLVCDLKPPRKVMNPYEVISSKATTEDVEPPTYRRKDNIQTVLCSSFGWRDSE